MRIGFAANSSHYKQFSFKHIITKTPNTYANHRTTIQLLSTTYLFNLFIKYLGDSS